MKCPVFKIQAIKVVAPYRLAVTFGDKMTMEINFSGIIDRHHALTPLKDPGIFSLAQVDESGSHIMWMDEIDLAGDNLRAEAVEQTGGISHERICSWMHRNNLTLDKAATALGISRRMIAYYRTGEKPIPKYIWLACLGWEHCAEHK
jgi:hypothetical protein